MHSIQVCMLEKNKDIIFYRFDQEKNTLLKDDKERELLILLNGNSLWISHADFSNARWIEDRVESVDSQNVD